MKISEIKGVGEKLEKVFHRAGVDSVGDLLKYYPKNYDIYEEPVLINELENDRVMAIKAEVAKNLEIKRVRNLVIINAYLRDENGMLIRATWFNAAYLRNMLTLGSVFVFRSRIVAKNGAYILEQPQIYTMEQYKEKLDTLQPLYPLVSGLTNNIVSKSVKQALKICELLEEYMPESIKREYNLADYDKALKKIHFPERRTEVIEARKRLVFDEFFAFIYTLKKYKDNQGTCENYHKISVPSGINEMISKLSYELTNAQKHAWEEIKKDFLSEKPMNRLVQGDVGSGKTIIAILSLFSVALNGKQAAIMAPTEVLAKQHFVEICRLIDENDFDFEAVLLVGSMTVKEKRECYTRIKDDDKVKIIVGTHAIFQDKAEYNNLALVVTDEQHRFGVRQREAISRKGENLHVIVMSATPIPRTLAIIMYGDLDISVIDELPANRLPIKNCVVGNEYRQNSYRFMEKQIAEGRQVYVICPTVEYSEAVEGENVIDYAKKLQDIFPPSVKIQYLHGRMKASEKNAIMEKFAENEIQILVSTTVVEVGVNVPNATVIMIENAERFGLAGLHQLRGRVGRGKYQSYCIFINGSGKKEASERLDILAKSNDGFYIAGEDLKLRGPGDFFGIRQSGDMEFRIGDIYTDSAIIKQAVEAVSKFFNGDFIISENEKRVLEMAMKAYTRMDEDRINI